MISKTLLLTAIAVVLVHCKEAPESTSGWLEDPIYKALDHFVKMVDEHKMNITIITSKTKYHMPDALKFISEAAMLTPPNNVHLKESKLTKDKANEWISHMEKQKIYEIRSLGARHADVETKKIDILGGGHFMPKTASYDWITNFDKTLGRQAFKVDNENVQAMYNIKVNKPDKYLVELITSNMTISELKRSPKMDDDTVKIMEAIIFDMWHMFSDDTEYAKALVRVLDKKLPGKDWNAIVGVTHFDVQSDLWVLIKVIDQNVLIYSEQSK